MINNFSADAVSEKPSRRVLIVVRRLKTGGIEKATLNLASGLISQGHAAHVLLLKGSNQLPLPDGVVLHSCNISKLLRKDAFGLFVYILSRLLLRLLIPGSAFVWEGWLYSRILHQYVHEIESRHGEFDLVLLRGQGVFESVWNFKHPNLWQVVEGPPLSFHCHPFARWFYRLLYKQKQIVTVSEGIGAVLQSELSAYGVTVKRAEVIHNLLPLAEIRRLAAEQPDDLPAGAYILHVGRLAPVKNQALLLDAYAASGLTMPLVIVGDGGERRALQERAKTLGISDKVLFLGEKQNPYCYMANAKVFVLSSRMEGFGLVLVESLACGTQVVATDVPGGIREVLIGEQTRLLAENSIAGLAAKMREAVEFPVTVDPAWAERFAPEQIVPKFLQLILTKQEEK